MIIVNYQFVEVLPCRFGLFPSVPIPSSCMFVMPMIIAPADLSLSTKVASLVLTSFPKNTVPQRR